MTSLSRSIDTTKRTNNRKQVQRYRRRLKWAHLIRRVIEGNHD